MHLRELWIRLRRPASDDLAEEIEAHLEMAADDQGRVAAVRRFGNRTAIAERARDAWGWPAVESFLKDARYGLRAIRRSPGFSAVVILTLALGIGLNTAIFSVVHAVLLKPLPYPDAERLVLFGESMGRGTVSATWVNFQHWRDDNHTFEAMAARQFTAMTLTGRGEPLETRGLVVTAPYCGLVGMRPLLGRLLTDDDDRAGAAAVVVLNHRFWSAQLGGDPQVVGTTLTLNGASYEVIGVATPLWEPYRVDYYVALGRQNVGVTGRARHGSIRVIGRLKRGVTVAAATADLDAIMRHLAEVDPGPENAHRSAGMYWAREITGGVGGTLAVLMGAAGLILLIACANVASLLLARNSSRAGELAVRKAIGAGRLRLMRQLLTENAILAGVGGVAGILLARAALRLLLALAPRDIPRLLETSLDVAAVLFAFAITVGAGVIAGIAPVIPAGRMDLTDALKEGARLAGGGRRRQMLRNLLVVGEVALTFVLAFGSGLLVRSLLAAQNASPGYDPRQAIAFSLKLPGPAYRNAEAIAAFYGRLLADLRAIPGVAGAGAVFCGPGAGDCGDWWYSIPGRPVPARNEVPLTLTNIADAGYFGMMRIPVIAGREFNDSDRAGGRRVVVVNQTFARRWWPDEPAVGRQIKLGGPYLDGPLLEIVGVAGDVKQFELDTQPMPEMYEAFSQKTPGNLTIVLRAAGDPAGLMSAVRSRVRALDANLPLQGVTTLEKSLGDGLARRRFSTVLLALFAGLAMVLAAIGIYGLLSYWVSVREPEIALRLALGARSGAILRWTAAQALRLAGAGIGLGVAGGWAAARGLEGLVYGIAPRNPATMALAAVVVGAIAVGAAAVPAWRAARVDVAERLRGA